MRKSETNLVQPRQFIALVLASLLIPMQLPAKSKNKPGAGDTALSVGLKIFILEGKDAVNFIPQHRGVTPVVEVRDDNDLPVEGVKVDFQLPDSGPGGEFEDGKHLMSVLTTLAGQAQAPFNVNTLTGKYNIQITAKIDTRMASTVITESNSMKAGERTTTSGNHHFYTDWRILTAAGVGVAGIVAVLLLTGGSSSSSPSTAVVLTPGGPTFGTPH